jgi:hypothetical protein
MLRSELARVSKHAVKVEYQRLALDGWRLESGIEASVRGA